MQQLEKPSELTALVYAFCRLIFIYSKITFLSNTSEFLTCNFRVKGYFLLGRWRPRFGREVGRREKRFCQKPRCAATLTWKKTEKNKCTLMFQTTLQSFSLIFWSFDIDCKNISKLYYICHVIHKSKCKRLINSNLLLVFENSLGKKSARKKSGPSFYLT